MDFTSCCIHDAPFPLTSLGVDSTSMDPAIFVWCGDEERREKLHKALEKSLVRPYVPLGP